MNLLLELNETDEKEFVKLISYIDKYHKEWVTNNLYGDLGKLIYQIYERQI